MSTDAASGSRSGGRTETEGGTGSNRLGTDEHGFGPGTFRLLALGCVLVLTASYVSVLREVTRVVGGTQSLFLLVGAMVLVATGLAHVIRPRTATVTAIVAAAVGFTYYLETSGVGVGVVFEATGTLVGDVFRLLTGLELLRMVEAGVWTLGFAPGPVFLSWYLAVRGRYGLSVLPGGFALVFLVLTGDAETTITLLGMLAAIGAVGFGELANRGGSVAQADLLTVLFAVIIVLSLSISVVPSGTAGPITAGTGGTDTLEGTIDSSPERSGFSGQVDLSPEVRFTVESDRESYWRTGVYDRYTGDEWIRSGQSQDVEALETPPQPNNQITQVVTAQTELNVMPAAAQPIAVEGDAAKYAEASAHGQLHPTTTLLEGDSYAVESAVVMRFPDALGEAGTDYPAEIEDHYLQTPESVSDEFETYTANVTEDAETPYEKAEAIEQYLRTSKDYSLSVDQPSGDVAEEFLLEMDEGYCVYFATTMTQMLRAEDVPARYVTGYTTGQQVGDDEYVVRGLDAHAWVEVYFPDHGWIAFEPTPPSERDTVHNDELAEAREDGLENVDTPESADVPIADDDPVREEPTPTESNDPSQQPDDEPAEDPPEADADTEPESEPEPESDGDESNGTENSARPGGGPNVTATEAGESGERDVTDVVTITRETAALVAVALFGLFACVHRTGAPRRIRRTVGLYWHGRRRDPDRDAERAFRRLERLLAREYRPRQPSESARQYLSALSAAEATTDADIDAGVDRDTNIDADADMGTGTDGAPPPLALDDRTERVLACYERAIYGGGVSRADADDAIAAVDELVREHLPVIGRR